MQAGRKPFERKAKGTDWERVKREAAQDSPVPFDPVADAGNEFPAIFSTIDTSPSLKREEIKHNANIKAHHRKNHEANTHSTLPEYRC